MNQKILFGIATVLCVMAIFLGKDISEIEKRAEENNYYQGAVYETSFEYLTLE